MTICDVCKKKPSEYTLWTPDHSSTDMCYKCYKLWNKYKDKALEEAYQKLKTKMKKGDKDA